MNSVRKNMQTTGWIECVFCKGKMEKIEEKQRISTLTDEFVCAGCGFIANFVTSDVRNYFGVKVG